MTNLRWLELRQEAQTHGRPLKCPLCSFRFSFRHLDRAGRACPQCEVPLGYPYWYRVLLVTVYLCAAGYVMYAGYTGPDASGWLIASLPFTFVAGIAAQIFIQRVFPPKLAPTRRAALG